VSKYWRLLGSLTLLAVLAWRIDWSQVASASAHLDLGLWFLAVALYLGAQVVGALRWQMFARVLGLGGWWGQYVASCFIGMFFNLVLPTSVGGDVVRVCYLARYQDADAAAGQYLDAFLSVFADRASGLLVLIAMACVAAACCPVPLPAWVASVVAGTGGAALAGLAFVPALPRLRPYLAGNARLVRLIDGAILYLQHRQVVVGTTALSVLVQVANVVVVWLIGRALSLPVPLLYYAVLVPLVALLTLLPVSLNGMGLREVGMVVLLAPLGVDAASAVALSLLTSAALAAASVVGVGFYLFGRFPHRAAPGEPVGGDPDQGPVRQPPAAA
jgi:uncharacterized membrane protein YbhN (UPF0104 family)